MEMNWIKIEDDIPDIKIDGSGEKQTVNVLVTDGKQIDMGYLASYVYDDSEDDFEWYQAGIDGYKMDYMEITHWMPLPELP